MPANPVVIVDDSDVRPVVEGHSMGEQARCVVIRMLEDLNSVAPDRETDLAS